MPHINDDKIYAYILLRLNKDGTLAQPPVITDGMMNPDQRALFDAFASSAIRALIQCQPYTMFKPEKIRSLKELEPRFFPNMFGGAETLLREAPAPDATPKRVGPVPRGRSAETRRGTP